MNPELTCNSGTHELGEFVADATLADVPADVVAQAKIAIADTVATMVAGATEHPGRILIEYAESATGLGLTPWTGVDSRVPAELLAMVSSALCHAMDFDDVLPGAGHPSAPVLSAALAMASTRTVSGRRLIEAYVVGVEVMKCVSRALGHMHYRHGWHTTSTVGCFAAGATVAKLIGLDAAAVENLMGVAASQASGTQRNFGTFTKPLHSGLASRNGVEAARLAAAGWTADRTVFGGKLGFLEMYGVGANHPQWLKRAGQPYALADPGISLKKYPCCFEVYRPIESVLELHEQRAFGHDEVEELTCTVPPGTLGPLINRWPTDPDEARFSIEYALAAALVDADVDMRTFESECVVRPDLRAKLPLLRIVEDVRVRPEDPSGERSSASTGGFVETTVRLADGSSYTSRVHEAPGTPRFPLSADERRAKFTQCVVAGGQCDDESALALYAELGELEQVDDVGALLDGALDPLSRVGR